MSHLIRSYVAVPAGEHLVRDLSARLDGWRDRLPVRWTRSETWHLTLQFLGDWPADRLERLGTALGGLPIRGPVALDPLGLGAFPDLNRPRVLFLQYRLDGHLSALAGDVREQVAEIWPDGPQDTRPFRPHLTLARIRVPLSLANVKRVQEIELTGLPAAPVTVVEVRTSGLGLNGPEPSVLYRQRLRKKGE